MLYDRRHARRDAWQLLCDAYALDRSSELRFARVGGTGILAAVFPVGDTELWAHVETGSIGWTIVMSPTGQQAVTTWILTTNWDITDGRRTVSISIWADPTDDPDAIPAWQRALVESISGWLAAGRPWSGQRWDDGLTGNDVIASGGVIASMPMRGSDA